MLFISINIETEYFFSNSSFSNTKTSHHQRSTSLTRPLNNEERMDNDDDSGPFVESCGQRYRVMVLKDFCRFRAMALEQDNWTTHFSDAKITVQTKPPPGGSRGGLNMVRVRREMKDVPPQVLYDNLHDAEYRKTWDANMLAGYNICDLNKHNDIGYYGAKFPWPLANRDFCNMRSWMEFTNGEFLIFNHSVPHNDCPEKKGFVRAKSVITGYYIQLIPNNPNGCILLYVTHTDVCGSIPHSVINFSMKQAVPNIMTKMEECALKYVQFSKDRYAPGHVHHWRTPKMDWDSTADYPSPTPPTAAEPPKAQVPSPTLKASLREDAGAPEQLPVSHETQEQLDSLRAEVAELQRKLFIAKQNAGGASASPFSLAPVAPAQEDDSPAVQQYRALMQDTLNTLDRMYIQEGRVPTAREYLTRLHAVLDGLKRTIPR